MPLISNLLAITRTNGFASWHVMTLFSGKNVNVLFSYWILTMCCFLLYFFGHMSCVVLGLGKIITRINGRTLEVGKDVWVYCFKRFCSCKPTRKKNTRIKKHTANQNKSKTILMMIMTTMISKRSRHPQQHQYCRDVARQRLKE